MEGSHLLAVSLKKTLTGSENLGSMKHMKTQTIGLTLAFCFFGAAACVAADPHIGTWKLNEAKSKITPGTLKNTTVVYKSTLGQVKVTTDGINANGKPAHSEWSGKLDGKDYSVTGTPDSDARSYTKVNDRTLQVTAKKNGKVIAAGQTAVSADGKSRTGTITGTNPKGKKFRNTAVYEKVS